MAVQDARSLLLAPDAILGSAANSNPRSSWSWRPLSWCARPAPAVAVALIWAGAATASVITYLMPVVALFLGVSLLGEQLTIGAVAGLILIGIGAWLATSRQPPAVTTNRTRCLSGATATHPPGCAGPQADGFANSTEPIQGRPG
jgi:EamA-like transporter family